MRTALDHHEALTDQDRAISQCVKRVSAQITLIGKLTRQGQDASGAKALLQALAQSLKEQRLRRKLLLAPRNEAL